MKRIPWDNNPNIGFWIENDPVRLYKGIDLISLDVVAKQGIRAPVGRWLHLNLDPITALLPVFNAVLVIDLPARWMMEHMDQRLGGNKEAKKNQLLSKDLYTTWKRRDVEYYTSTVIRIAKEVPPRYISGFMLKG